MKFIKENNLGEQLIDWEEYDEKEDLTGAPIEDVMYPNLPEDNE